MDARSERRVITALFIDVVGSTDLMMRVGPEVMRRRLVDAFSQMAARIAEHGGTIENYAGDSIFAIFGAPTARVDDAVRALRAAQACAAWSTSADFAVTRDEHLAIRVGIETGEALIDLDAVGHQEHMAIGPCVNVAARLQQQADPGQIVVGPTAHAATETVARYQPLGLLNLKGLGEMEAWRFLEFAEATEVASVPFVGRAAELQTLIEAAERSASGERLLALVTGAPGLGKSRLVQELVRQRRTANTRVIEIRCRPAGEDGENTPLRQLLEADLADPTPEAVRGRLDELLGPESAAPAATAILHSTGLQSSDSLQAITRYEQRVNIAEAWKRYLTALAARRPLIVAVEDVHWGDAVLVFMLYHATSAGSARLMIVATARPEFEGSPLIGAAHNMVKLDLSPLGPEASAELAVAARGAIQGLDRAAGNPLFIIELARAQFAASSHELPLTIQAAIAARLDELSADERQLLQHVSVAGETFGIGDAALLSEREPTDVAGMLGRIAHLGFVEYTGHQYRFHHALIRDVAYSRLPVTTRAALHARYADEGVAADPVARAFHLWEAVKPPDAVWVWDDADRLRRLQSVAFDAQLTAAQQLEAWNQYEQAEEVYGRAADLASDPVHRARALTEQSRTQDRQGKGDDAWANRMQAIEAYRLAGIPVPARLYADMLEIITFNWGYFLSLPADDEVVRLIDEGLEAARTTGDDASRARLLTARSAISGDASGAAEVLAFLDSPNAVTFAGAVHRQAEILIWNGELAHATEIYGRVFDDLQPRGAVFNEPEALLWYAQGTYASGNLAKAAALVDRSREDLKNGRSAHTQSHVLGIRSELALGRGDWSELLAVTAELESLLAAHPDEGFCLVGGAALGFGAVGRLHEGMTLPNDIAADAARMIDESELVQASSIMLAQAMLGNVDAAERGLRAYRPGLRLTDRAAVWDVLHLMPAILAVMLERWDLLVEPLRRLEHCAARGSLLASAAIAAIAEERGTATGTSGNRSHDALRALGYAGISDLLGYRAVGPASPKAA